MAVEWNQWYFDMRTLYIVNDQTYPECQASILCWQKFLLTRLKAEKLFFKYRKDIHNKEKIESPFLSHNQIKPDIQQWNYRFGSSPHSGTSTNRLCGSEGPNSHQARIGSAGGLFCFCVLCCGAAWNALKKQAILPGTSAPEVIQQVLLPGCGWNHIQKPFRYTLFVNDYKRHLNFL